MTSMADDAQNSAAAPSFTAPLAPAADAPSTSSSDTALAADSTVPSAPSSSCSLFKKKSSHRSAARRTGPSSPPPKSEKEQEADAAEDEAERSASRTSTPLHHHLCRQHHLRSLPAFLCFSLCRKRVEDTRLLQRFRATQHSTSAAMSLTSLTSPTASAMPSQSAAMGGRLIGATFQAEVETQDLVQLQMHAFIEAEIEKRRREREGGKRSREEDELEERQKADAAALHLGAVDESVKEVAALLRKKPVLDEKEEESADRWLRGISEVPLPISSVQPHRSFSCLTSTLAMSLFGSDQLLLLPLCLPGCLLDQSPDGEHRADGSRSPSAAATSEAEVDHSSPPFPLSCRHRPLPKSLPLTIHPLSSTPFSCPARPPLPTRRCPPTSTPILPCTRPSGTQPCASSGARTRRPWRSTERSNARWASRWTSRATAGEAEGEGGDEVGEGEGGEGVGEGTVVVMAVGEEVVGVVVVDTGAIRRATAAWWSASSKSSKPNDRRIHRTPPTLPSRRPPRRCRLHTNNAIPTSAVHVPHASSSAPCAFRLSRCPPSDLISVAAWSPLYSLSLLSSLPHLHAAVLLVEVGYVRHLHTHSRFHFSGCEADRLL